MSISDRSGPAPETVLVSSHAAARYRDRVRPALDLDAAQAELERLRATSEISTVTPTWVHAAKHAPYYMLLGEGVVLPVLRQGAGWIATTCLSQGTLTPTRRRAKSARKKSLSSRRRARRRTRW